MNDKQKPSIRFTGFTEAWEQRKFGDVVAKLTGGCSIAPDDYIEDGCKTIPKGAVNNSGVADLSGCKFISRAFFEGNISSTVSTGNLVTSLRDLIPAAPNMGRIVRITGNKEDYLMPQGVYKIELNDGVDEDFVIAYSNGNSYRQIISSEKNGSTQVHIRNGEFLNIDIPLPNQYEQEKIGAYFKNLDHLITLHQRKCDKLVNVKKSMLEKMFPKNDSNVPSIRFAGFTEAWEQRKLGEIATEVNRNDPESTAPIMMITANNGFIEQSERYAFNNAGESLKKYILLEKGELAYNHGASKLRPYGSCFALTTVENARIPFVYHCFSVGENDSEFVSIELNGSEIESQLRRSVSSGARMDGLLNISYGEYSNVELKMPSVKEQQAISRFFHTLDHLITLHQRELEKLQNIKKSCLEKMFV